MVWGMAAVIYAGFLGWYQNWRRPLRPDEVEMLIRRIEAAGGADNGRNDIGALRRFLAADDGREFFMLNLVKLADGEVGDPASGERRSARAVMAGYTRVFLPALLARGGHPAVVAPKAGPYFDAWGVAADPGWTLMGFMRYRSRRDLAELVADPRFHGAHDFKFAAMPVTFSFPTQPRVLALASPRVWVGLVLALVAALAQIAWLL